MSQKPDPHISAEVKINLTILVLGAMVMILNETALSVALPTIMADFGIPATSAQWLLTGFLLTMGVVIPTTGFLMDKFTTRQIFLASSGVFLAGTVLAALAPAFGVLLVGNMAMQRKEWRTVWPWLLTPTLALMFYGSTKLYAESAPVVPALQSHWLPIHVTVVSLGASIGIISGIVSLLTLFRMAQPKHAEHGFFGAVARPLPSAAKIDQLAYRLAVITLPTLGLGIILGAIWAESAWGRFWGWDPKETVSFATWILYAAYLHARATPAFRKAAPWINVMAMALMVFNLFFINMVVSGLHSYAGLN